MTSVVVLCMNKLNDVFLKNKIKFWQLKVAAKKACPHEQSSMVPIQVFLKLFTTTTWLSQLVG